MRHGVNRHCMPRPAKLRLSANMRSLQVRRWLLALAIGTAALTWPIRGLAEVNAQLSADRVAPGQAVTLILRQTGSSVSTPDLSPLQKDFHIVERSTVDDMQIVNGRRREQRQLHLTLLPRATGTLTVPPIQIGGETTPALPLTVVSTAATKSRLLGAPADAVATGPLQTSPPPESLSVDARIEPKRVRVGQQVLLIVEVTSAEGPPTGRLLAPEIADARVLPLGEERRVETGADAVASEDESGNLRGSRHLYERRFALFPGTAGSIDIPPLQFDAWQPSGGNPVPVRSAPLQLAVDPIPQGIAEQDWLPARALSLTEAGPSQVRMAPGQALERMITLRADGLMAEDLPALPLAIPFQLRIRDDPPRLWNERNPDGVVGYRSERILISSAETGSYLLKGPVIDWWDSARGTPARASLPDWTLTVAAYQSADQRPAAVWPRPETKPQSRPSPSPSAGPWDAPGDPQAQAGRPAASSPQSAPRQEAAAEFWRQAQYWSLGGAALLAIVSTLVMITRRRRARSDPSAPAKTKQRERTSSADSRPVDAAERPIAAAIDAVEQAYLSGNAASARQALLDWAALIWPEQTPANLAQVAIRVEEPLRDDILLLEKAFFSPTPLNWIRADLRSKLAAAARSA